MFSDAVGLMDNFGDPFGMQQHSRANRKALSDLTNVARIIDGRSSLHDSKISSDSCNDSSANKRDQVNTSYEPDDRDSKSRRKPRTVFSRSQLNRMKDAFNRKPYLSTEERKSLAAEIKVTAEQIKVWFQNHRSKLKRQGKMIHTTHSREHSPPNVYDPNNGMVLPSNGTYAHSPFVVGQMAGANYLKPVYGYPQGYNYEYYQQPTGNNYPTTENIFTAMPFYPQVAAQSNSVDTTNSFVYQGPVPNIVRSVIMNYQPNGTGQKSVEYTSYDPKSCQGNQHKDKC